MLLTSLRSIPPLFKPFGQSALAGMLTLGLLAQCLPAFSQPEVLTGEVNLSVTPSQVQKSVQVRGGNQVVNLAFRDIAIRDALRALGRKGGFNVAINDSVTGQISIDLKGITIQEALEAIRTQSDLSFSTRGGKTLMVSTLESVQGQELQRTHSDVIPLKHANASVLAQILNQSVFAPSGLSQVQGNTGGGVLLTITPDFRTNSLIVVGRPDDVKTAHEYVKVLDVPRESKTWRLSHADAVDVASILSSSLFNEGNPTLQFQSSGGGGGGAGGGGGQSTLGVLPSTLRVRTEEIEEGDGGTSTENTGGGEGTEGVASDVTLRAQNKVEEFLLITPTGVIFFPYYRLNTLTLFGTAEQVRVADRMIANLDRRAPQVVIETTLIEINETARKELSFNYALDGLHVGASTNNPPPNGTLGGPIPFVPGGGLGIPSDVTDVFSNLFRFTSNFTGTGTANEFFYQLNALVSNQRAQVIANPTIVSVSDKESIVSIVDEIIESVSVTIDSAGGGAVGQEVNIGEVGVILHILPKVAPNGDVNMRIRPSLTTIASIQTDANGNLITLLNRREAVAQNVIMHDGETFILGGLIVEEDSNTLNKAPFFGDLPIVGALARASNRNKRKRELMIIITPHIVTDHYRPVVSHYKIKEGRPTQTAIKRTEKTKKETEKVKVEAEKKNRLKLAGKDSEAFNLQALTVDGTKDYLPEVNPTTPLSKMSFPKNKGVLAHPVPKGPAKNNTRFLPALKKTKAVTVNKLKVVPPAPKAVQIGDVKPKVVSPSVGSRPPRVRKPDLKVRGPELIQPRLNPAIIPTVKAPMTPRKAFEKVVKPLNTSDEAINAIIRKFLPQFDPTKDLY